MTTIGPPPQQPPQLVAPKLRDGTSSRSPQASDNDGFWVPLDDASPEEAQWSVEPSRTAAEADGFVARFKLRCDALVEKTRTGASFEELAAEFPEVPGWTVSLVVHVLVLLALSLFHMQADADLDHFEIITDITEMPEELDIVDLTSDLDEEKVASAADISLTKGGAASVENAVSDLNKIKEPVLELLAEATLEASVSPIENDVIDIALSETVGDMVGEIVNTDNDEGSVDRITTEILNRLKRHKVLVVWLMDASASLRTRREEIIKRFDRIYHELDQLGGIQDDALLTAVVAFGEKSVRMMPEPTASREEVHKAVQNIKTDESGVENVFGAIGWAATEYRKFQTGDRKTMLIVLTDEIGDDLMRVEDAIKALQRYKMPVFVMGPTAPFGSTTIKMKWTDEITGEVFHLPVDRGPETLVVEHAKLPSWNNSEVFGLISSGFGPYGLSRVVRDSGGIYFLYEDGSIPGPRFDVQNMLAVIPDYISQADYQRLAIKSPLRSGVLKIAEATQKPIGKLPNRFLAAGIQFEIKKTVKTLEQVVHFLNQAISELQQAENFRKKEASKRWQAHYDLMMGRMLVNRVRCYRSIPHLQEMYEKPKAPKSGTTNGWELAGDESTALAKMAAAAEAGAGKKTAGKKPAGKGKAQNADPTAADVPLARLYLERVVREHPNTPWGVMAQSELDFPLDFQWKETFIDPPEGAKLPWDKIPWDKLTDAQKKAKKSYEAKKAAKKKKAQKRKEAEKRVPKKL